MALAAALSFVGGILAATRLDWYPRTRVSKIALIWRITRPLLSASMRRITSSPATPKESPKASNGSRSSGNSRWIRLSKSLSTVSIIRVLEAVLTKVHEPFSTLYHCFLQHDNRGNKNRLVIFLRPANAERAKAPLLWQLECFENVALPAAARHGGAGGDVDDALDRGRAEPVAGGRQGRQGRPGAGLRIVRLVLLEGTRTLLAAEDQHAPAQRRARGAATRGGQGRGLLPRVGGQIVDLVDPCVVLEVLEAAAGHVDPAVQSHGRH